MSGSQSSTDVFDMRKVRKLIALMKEHDLTEIDLKQADSAVRIKRGGEVVSYSAPVAPPAAPAPAAAAASASPSAEDTRMVVVKSPMVGTLASRARAWAEFLSPTRSIASGVGPMKPMSHERQTSAKCEFSDRNP